MAKNKIRIRLKAFESRTLDAAVEKIVSTVKNHGVKKSCRTSSTAYRTRNRHRFTCCA